MSNKENCVRLTRSAAAARKRAPDTGAAVGSPGAGKRQRVVLGELPDLSNAAAAAPHRASGPRQGVEKPKSRTRRSKQRERTVQLHQEKEEEQKSPALDPAVVDIDLGVEDPQFCAHYASDIYRYLRSMEVEPKRRPLANFVDEVQRDVTANMRAILVDWLVEVAEEYKLVSDSLYLTVSHIDRFLSSNAINRQRLQLLGVSCMLIASKYEEISPPHVEDFCYITDNTYTKEEVVKMETDILKVLNFEMGNPTVKTFLRRFVRAGQEDCKPPSLQLEFLTNYLAELSLLDYGCVRFIPSIVAASAVFVARFTINPSIHPWTQTLQHYSGYKPSELKDCVHAIHDLQLNKKGSSLVAIRDKYKQHKFKCVGTLVSHSEIPSSYIEDIP